jgi:carbamoyltransferase
MFEDVFVPSAPGDSGTAIGAALLVKREEGMTNVPEVARNPYLGPGFDRDEVYRTIERRGLRCEIPSDPVSFLADRLVGGEIVGVFRGRLEAGPRALGNRSILAAPMFKDMTTRLNDAVKFREPFRPFAPSVLAHRVGEWFEASPDSPFMSFAVQVRPDRAARVPAIVHVDGTARVQTVYETLNPFFFALLTKFEGITGIPMLVNTSLNVKGKPICGTPEMALECLCESGLDGLLIEDFYVRPSREATPAGLTDRAHRI